MLASKVIESEYLRILITDVYRGHPDERLRRYSGCERHLLYGISRNVFDNCPLWSTLGLLYRSTLADTKKSARTSSQPIMLQAESEDSSEEEGGD